MKRSVALAFVILAVGVGAWVLSRTGSRTRPERVEPQRAGRATVHDPAGAESENVVLARPLPIPDVAPEREESETAKEDERASKPGDTRNAAGVRPYVPSPPLPPRPAQPGRIAGWLLDEHGVPYEDAVKWDFTGPGGGHGWSGTGDAGFDIEDRGYETYVVRATTTDGRIALFQGRRGDSDDGIGDVILRLERGAIVELSLDGERDRTRCALTTEGVLHADFTLRKGSPARQVVPVGALHVRLYDGDDVHAERSVRLAAGEEHHLGFTLAE